MSQCDFEQLPDGRWQCRDPECGYVTKRAYDRPPNSNCKKKLRAASGARPYVPIRGPGAWLLRLFAEINVTPKPECHCSEYAAKMDAWGVEGCRERRAEIISHLKDDAAKYGLGEWAVAGWTAFWQGKPLSLGGLVDEAIRRAATPAGSGS